MVEQLGLVTSAPGHWRSVTLCRERRQVIRVDLWNHQRHVWLHAVGRGVAEDKRSGAGERWLDGFRLRCGQRREDDGGGRAIVGRWARQSQRGGLGWRVALDAPVNDITIEATSVSLGGRDARQPKPRMVGEQRHQPLAHESGGPQHGRWDTARRGIDSSIMCHETILWQRTRPM